CKEIVTISQLLAAVDRLEGCPELRIITECKVEILGQHADDGVGNTTQLHRLSDYILYAAKPPLPGSVAQHDRIRRARNLLAGIKIAAQHRHHTQRTKEPGTDPFPPQRLGSRGRTQQKVPSREGIKGAEDRVLSLPVFIVEVRYVHKRGDPFAFRHSDQSLGICVRKWLDESRVDKREDR